MCTDDSGEDIIGREVDFDFKLQDPANDDTDVDVMFEKFKKLIEPVLQKYNP